MAKKSIVSARHLSKQFGEFKALEDINLEVPEGEFLSIIGASGCGKSTLLRLIGGLEGDFEGELLVRDSAVIKPSRKVGFVFQDHRLLPWLTVAENIKLGLEKKCPNANEIVKENLRLVHLENFENAYPSQLSGGMAQRVAIARALANHPDILLLDEPFGALDAMTRINMQIELRRIWEQEKITMILITHDIEEAVYMGQRVVVLSSSPGHIKKIVPIESGCHYNRNSMEFARAKEHLYTEFFKEEEVPFTYSI